MPWRLASELASESHDRKAIETLICLTDTIEAEHLDEDVEFKHTHFIGLDDTHMLIFLWNSAWKHEETPSPSLSPSPHFHDIHMMIAGEEEWCLAPTLETLLRRFAEMPEEIPRHHLGCGRILWECCIQYGKTGFDWTQIFDYGDEDLRDIKQDLQDLRRFLRKVWKVREPMTSESEKKFGGNKDKTLLGGLKTLKLRKNVNLNPNKQCNDGHCVIV